MGADNLLGFSKWKNYELILKKYPIYVYPRANNVIIDVAKMYPNANIKITEAPVVEISSTFIRSAVKAKKDVRFFLPAKVNDYMLEMHLYEK